MSAVAIGQEWRPQTAYAPPVTSETFLIPGNLPFYRCTEILAFWASLAAQWLEVPTPHGQPQCRSTCVCIPRIPTGWEVEKRLQHARASLSGDFSLSPFLSVSEEQARPLATTTKKSIKKRNSRIHQILNRTVKRMKIITFNLLKYCPYCFI